MLAEDYLMLYCLNSLLTLSISNPSFFLYSIDCVGGKRSNEASGACTDCLVNQYEDNNECIAYETSTYSSAGSEECSACASGKVNPNPENEEEESADCFECPNGKMANSGTKCVECDVGKFRNDGTEKLCISCALGFSSAKGESSCEACPSGSTTFDFPQSESDNKARICRSCLIGQKTENVDSAKEKCTRCEAGKVICPDFTKCEPCPIGHYSGGGRLASPSPCLECEKGKYASAGLKECTDCAIGRFAGAKEASECIDCPVGHVSQLDSGSELCDEW